ncbi:metallophosphoesterase family protein [Pedobacter sp. PLR]|uniref:metallophosphoesterase family protein n=1 Tax=Pedobacter sp. PLR TaxID=2994465 RepID=UPI002245A1B0|nr:metallophosphoesterase family protein [Pedobacter sp. PLR]MCX2453422.1 metallophosphoesterase family protein [Pedobacter sp. PLR]
MKIAIISDLHANLPALKAVLADISSFNPDQIYCLGDLTDAAPWHNEVIELIKAKHIPTIMGNHDERIAFDHPVYPLTKHNLREQEARLEAINYTKQHITASNKAFLAALPATIKLELAGMTILLVHGSPDSNEEYLYEDAEESRISEMFRKAQVEVIISGHTHVPFIRYLSESPVQNLPESTDQEWPGSTPQKTKLLINTGSVGRSKEKDRKACYLQLEILSGSDAVGLHRLKPLIRKIAYPIEETIRGIRSSPVPDFYADFLENTPD